MGAAGRGSRSLHSAELLEKKCSPETIREIVTSRAVETEREFVLDALKASLIGMNAAEMNQYVEFVAD